MRTAVVLFTRDLRVHDHPALAAAAREAERVVPLFVLDPAVPTPPNRTAFLVDALRDLDRSLRERGGALVVRHGDAVAEALRLAPDAVFLSEDVSALAQERLRRLRAARVDVRALPGVTIVPPGDVAPAGRSHYSVFTPYWRAWRQAPRRALLPAPRRLLLPEGLEPGALPERPAPDAAEIPRGGERAARSRLAAFARDGLDRYEREADLLAADATSRLSPYLHLGCVSPLEVAERTAPCEPFVRQLCWRDFFHQLLAARPETAREDLHPGRRDWRRDDEALDRWRRGETGVPLVDAAMRQLLREGFVHNRARLVAASYLTKDVGLDWREGARWYARLLVDGDLASNTGNWQWSAGTGADTRPNRRLSPERQAKRFDPDGAYVERYLG